MVSLQGISPHIGENGNWFIGNTDTLVPATSDNRPYWESIEE